MTYTCRNCGDPIVFLMTLDGAGWLHTTDEDLHYRESCNKNGIGKPCAEPIGSPVL